MTVEQIVEIRRTTKTKLPYCIIVATAIVLYAVLLTGDPHFLRLTISGFNIKAIQVTQLVERNSDCHFFCFYTVLTKYAKGLGMRARFINRQITAL